MCPTTNLIIFGLGKQEIEVVAWNWSLDACFVNMSQCFSPEYQLNYFTVCDHNSCIINNPFTSLSLFNSSLSSEKKDQLPSA